MASGREVLAVTDRDYQWRPADDEAWASRLRMAQARAAASVPLDSTDREAYQRAAVPLPAEPGTTTPRPPVNRPQAATGRHHPATSHAAAARTKPRSGSDREKVLHHIADQAGYGATCDEVEAALRLTHQTCSARVNGLRDDGWIVDSGQRRLTRSQASAIVWWYVAE